MRNKVFQEILDSAPKSVEKKVRIMADLILKKTKCTKIGIDPGRRTGIAITGTDGKLRNLDTMLIHEAMEAVRSVNVPDMVVIVEDARKRSGNPQTAQGAGSVKRDCTIWEDFLKSLKISFKMVAPIRNGTKFRDQIFKAHYPYWTKRTSEHARAAANLLITK